MTVMELPLDRDLQTPESILAWIREIGVRLDIRELDKYPGRPLIFSQYDYDPPVITIYRYRPLEDWLNLMSQRTVGYYGPWYFLHIAFRLYFHLEMHGLYEIERKWYHRCLSRLDTLEARAYRFTRELLGTLHHPSRFDAQIGRSFQPRESTESRRM